MTPPASRSADQDPIVVLLEVPNSFERRLLALRARRMDDTALITVPGAEGDDRLALRLGFGDNPTFVPLRVVWSEASRPGAGRPDRDRGLSRGRWFRGRHPALVVGDPASLAELEQRWRSSDRRGTLSHYVERQAQLALDRAERAIRGSRYKVPRFVQDEVLRRPELLHEVTEIAEQTGEGSSRAVMRARRYLREIAALPNTHVIDAVANLVQWLYRRGYRDLHYPQEALSELSALTGEFPVAYLPSHQSNLDHLILAQLLWENDLPPNHTAGGVNMSFFPVGPIMRRTGVFFIRRTFREHALYKATLRSYLDYLIEKRFPLEWYLEGGRSRSGKLRPPRYGMLTYVVDSVRRGSSEDLYIVPVSIAYDQIHEVSAHAAEQRGEQKEPEGAGWLVRAVRSLRGRFGSIYVRFGEPISVARELPDQDESLAVQKLAFEVMARIQRVTPITEPALTISSLLSHSGRARSFRELHADIMELESYVRARGLPLAPYFALEDPEHMASTLELLSGRGVVRTFEGGAEPVYAVHPKRFHEAAYYRNTIVHHFATSAISEVSAVAAAEAKRMHQDALSDAAMAWRDLLKFEFFFAEKAAFLEEVRAELESISSTWASFLAEGQGSAERLLSRKVPLVAHWVLAPWIDGYLVVALALERQSPGPVDQAELLRRCLGFGHQLLMQGRIGSPESVSKAVFESAVQLAENRGLLTGSVDVAGRREHFASEVAQARRRVDVIRRLQENRTAP